MLDIVDELEVKSIDSITYPRSIKRILKNLDKGRPKLPINTIISVHINEIKNIGYGCGVYVLITKSGRIYIGSSRNVKNRIYQHRREQEYQFDSIESVIICTTENIRAAVHLEITLIRDIKPDINIRRYDGIDCRIKHAVKNLFLYSKN